MLAPFYIAAILLLARVIVTRNIKEKPYYRFFVPGLLCKIFGGIGLCLVYSFYYTEGGDVINYYVTATTYVNALELGHFEKFMELMDYRNNNVWDVLSYNNQYGYLMFSPNDYYALFTVTLTIPFCLLGCKSFIATTILLASASFIGLWRLYEVFVDHFPNLSRQFAIAVFFIPSVFFWGSGILKDTYTFSAIGFYIYGLYQFQILKKRKVKYILCIIGAILIFIYIKPYFFFALLPGSLVWMNFYRLSRIQNPILKLMAVPLLLSITVMLVIFVLDFFGQYLGEYSLDFILAKAAKTQQDLVREAYGTNSYNIGEFEPTIPGILSKTPAALNMAFFRPFIWDARNAMMILSGLETLFMMGFSIYILIRVKFSTLFKSLFSNPLLIFCFLFALFFAFSVGLTTANYGALARLRIPCIPFYLCSLFILYELNKTSFRRRSSGR